MSIRYTKPEARDIKKLGQLVDLIDSFSDAATDLVIESVEQGGMSPPDTPEEMEKIQIIDALMEKQSRSKGGGLLLKLHLRDFYLKSVFDGAALTEGLQEEMLGLIAEDIGSEDNLALMKKYQLNGLKSLASRRKNLG